MIDWQRRAKAMRWQAHRWRLFFREERRASNHFIMEMLRADKEVARLEQEKADLVRFITLQDQAIEDCKRRHGGTKSESDED